MQTAKKSDNLKIRDREQFFTGVHRDDFYGVSGPKQAQEKPEKWDDLVSENAEITKIHQSKVSSITTRQNNLPAQEPQL